MKLAERAKIKYVLVVQCDNARHRCSGFACENWFHQRMASFAGYHPEVRFLTVTCGGCGGLETLHAQLEHFKRKLLKKTSIALDEVSIHLSSCMVTDNSHHNRCVHVAEICKVINDCGFVNITEGSYVSARAQAKREAGIYKNYPTLEMT